MNKVNVESRPIGVNSGQVRLSASQAAARKHALKIVGKADRDGSAVYDVVAPIQFKVGEAFEFSGELSKSGQLRDAEAEGIAKLEEQAKAIEKAVAQVRAQYEAQLNRQRESLQAEFENRLAALHKAYGAKLDPAVAAEVEAGLKAPGK